MEGRRNADLLQETRRLLNVLNDENSELKSQNQELLEALEQANASKSKVETDMKKVNLNLMDQLHKKAAACKELEARLGELHEASDKESRRSTESMTRLGALEAENALLRENVRVLHQQCDSLSQQVVLAEDTAGRSTDQLNQLGHAIRSEHAAELRIISDKNVELEATVRSLQQQLHILSAEKGSLENTFNDLHAEHLALQHTYNVDLRAAQSASRRATSTEADVAYLHGQLLDSKSEAFDIFHAMRLYLQPLGDECERQGEEVGRLMFRVSGIAEAFNAVKVADDNMIAALHDRLCSREGHIAELQNALQLKQAEYASVEQRRQAMDAQLLRYKGEILNLTQVFAELQDGVAQSQVDVDGHAALAAEREGQIIALRDDVSREQRLNTELRLELENTKTLLYRAENGRQVAEVELAKERSLSTVRHGDLEQRLEEARHELREESRRSSVLQEQYEDEILHLRMQVDEHANTLSSALGRLRSSSIPHARGPPGTSESRGASLASEVRSKSEITLRPSLLAAASRLSEEENRTIVVDA